MRDTASLTQKKTTVKIEKGAAAAAAESRIEQGALEKGEYSLYTV